VCDEIHRSILKESVIAADETGRKVWNKQENKHKQEYAWILATEQEVFFAMGPGRHGEVAQQLIGKNRKGVLVVDKYAGYQSVREISPELALSYCITHAFRKFRDAQVEEQELATEIMTRYFGILYKVEERIKKKNMSLSKVAAYRLRVTLPVMTSLKERLLILQAEYSERPKSKLLEACNYMLSDWDGFMVFVYNPNVPIDNNPTERRLRGHAIGRKNWLWNMSEEGAEWVCNFYTIVESCLLIGVSPQTYLNEVLPLLPKASKADYASLTPRQWKERKEAKAQALQTPKAA
jgi:transposase